MEEEKRGITYIYIYMIYIVEDPEVFQAAVEPKLFGKWTYKDLKLKDNTLEGYVNFDATKLKIYLPHTAGRYQIKRFRKVTCPLVERIVNSLMFHGRNSGKKLKTMKIVKQTMEIIHLMTGENPMQVIIQAIENSGAREDSTRIGSGGVVKRQAVDVSPMRRVNMAIYYLCTGARDATFRKIKTMPECLAEEFMNAAKVYIYYIYIYYIYYIYILYI